MWQDDLAKDLAERWMKLNVKVYKATGKLMEKYDVMDLSNRLGAANTQAGRLWMDERRIFRACKSCMGCLQTNSYSELPKTRV